MTWRSSGGREDGFSLIEVIVVLVVLALVATIFVGRGPMRSRGVEAADAARTLAGAMRLARSQAIATDRTVSFSVDPARHLYVSGGAVHGLPGEIGLAVQGPDGEAAATLDTRRLRAAWRRRSKSPGSLPGPVSFMLPFQPASAGRQKRRLANRGVRRCQERGKVWRSRVRRIYPVLGKVPNAYGHTRSLPSCPDLIRASTGCSR